MFDSDAFWLKFEKDCFDNDCWLAPYRRKLGYYHRQYAPYYWFDGQWIQGHRLAYQIAYGSIPDKLVVRHRCGVGGCCNPAHLVLGTQQQNSWDRWARTMAGIEMGTLATYEDIPEYRPI
jgi:hypothetical protein